MPSSTPTARGIKKRPTVSRKHRSFSFALLRPRSSNRSAYKLNKKNAAHEQMMQRFQLRRVSAEQESSSRTIVIDKAIGVKRGKSSRSFIRRILLPLFDANLRKRAIQSLASPITPDSWAYTAYGTMMLLVYHFQLLYLPFALSFYPNGSTVTVNTSMVLEAVFMVDLLLNFNTAYVKKGAIVTSRAKIAQNYLRSWFAFDTLSAFPLQAIYYLAARCTDTTSTAVRGIQGALMVLRLVRVTFLEKGMLLGRVMRVASHVVEWVRYSRYSHLLAIAHLMRLVLLFAHYMACGWHLVARPHRLSEHSQTLGEQYVADYYYAISLIQGQGNTTGTWGENLYSAIAIIFGSVILAIVFGNVAMLVSNFNANTTNYHRKMEAVYATMDKMDLPLQLRERVNDYYAHIWLEYEALDGNINKFQQELTHTLRIEIGLYKFMNLMVNIPLWEDCTPDFLTQIVLSLGTRVYMPDDYVIRRREIGCEMMMINLGYCKLAKPIKHPEGLPKLAGKVSAVFDDHTSNRSQPVLSPTDLSSHSRAKSVRRRTRTHSQTTCYE